MNYFPALEGFLGPMKKPAGEAIQSARLMGRGNQERPSAAPGVSQASKGK